MRLFQQDKKPLSISPAFSLNSFICFSSASDSEVDEFKTPGLTRDRRRRTLKCVKNLRNICYCAFLTRLSMVSLCRPKKVEDAKRDKTELTRTLAERCLAGEFGGIPYRAAQSPEAVELGIRHSMIHHYMNQIDPTTTFDRVADRLRVEHETTQAEK